MQGPPNGQTTYYVDPTGRYVRVIIATKDDYGTDQAKKFTGRLRGSTSPGGIRRRGGMPEAGRPPASTSSTAPTACSHGWC